MRQGKIKWADLWDRKTGLPYTLEQMGVARGGGGVAPRLAAEVMPNLGRAVIAPEKISGYLLREGSNKARVFMAAFGLTAEDAEFLNKAMLSGLSKGQVTSIKEKPFGTSYTVRISLTGKNNYTENITTAWQYDTGKDFPRFITAYLRGKRGQK